jgi:hypothetical protein
VGCRVLFERSHRYAVHLARGLKSEAERMEIKVVNEIMRKKAYIYSRCRFICRNTRVPESIKDADIWTAFTVARYLWRNT